MTRHALPSRGRGRHPWLGLARWASALAVCALGSPSQAQQIPAPGVAPLVVDAEALTRCAPTESSEGYFGVYRSDKWPRGNVVLTFDDGPHVVHTKRVLRLLDRHRLTATFFLVGRAINARTYPLVQRMVAEGHLIGSHSYDHDISMAFENGGDATVEYIFGQHQVTQISIELALLARSPEHFDAMYTEVFERSPYKPLTRKHLQHDWADFAARHRTLLERHGFSEAHRPYPIVYSRPPGGGPYLSRSHRAAARRYDQALERLGWLNILWHGGSGDTDAARRKDFGFLVGNMSYVSRRGGVLLMHDGMRPDALDHALGAIARHPDIEVVSLDRAIQRKFGCSPEDLRHELSASAAR